MQGRDTITQRVAIEGGPEADKVLDDIGAHGEAMFRRLEDGSKRSFRGFGDRIKAVGEGFRAFRERLSGAHEGFTRLSEAGAQFNESLRQTTERIFPHFAEIIPAGVAAATAGFLELTKKAAEGVKEIENLAAALGITFEQMEGLQLVAARAGISNEQLTIGLSRYAQALGRAREEHVKLTGQMDSGVQVVRGNAKAISDTSIALRGGVHNANQAVFDQTSVLRGGQKAVFDFSNAFKALGINLGDFRDNSAGFIKSLEETARRIDALGPSAIKAQVAMQLFGRNWIQIVPAFANLTPRLREALVQIQQFTTGIEEEEKKQALGYLASFETLKIVTTRVAEIFGNIFGQLLVPIFDALTALLTVDLEKWKEWSNGIVNNLVPKVKAVVADLAAYLRGTLTKEQLSTDFARSLISAFQTIAGAARIALSVIAAGFTLLSRILDPIAGLVNRIFGTQFTGETLAAAAAVLHLVGAFRLLATAITLVWQSILFFGGVPVLIAVSLGIIIAYFYAHWNEVRTGFNVTWELISAGFQHFVVDPLVKGANWIGKQLTDAWNVIGKFFGDYVVDPIVKGFNIAIYWVDYFIGLVEKALDKVKSLFGGTAQGAQAGVPSAPSNQDVAFAQGQFAGGGDVRGPGGVDRVPAWLTAGEFVHRVAAVQHYGLAFMRRLNNLQIPRFELGGLVPAFAGMIQQFAGGGLVDAIAPVMPTFAQGSLVSIDLTHFGSTFKGILAPHSVAEAMLNYSDGLRIRRTGKIPGFRGG